MSTRLLLAVITCLTGFVSALADEQNRRLDIYFIDVEGGAATLFVTPEGETLLIDSGYPDYGNRDRDRILHVLREVAQKTQLDHAMVSHWHLDHYGNHAALAHEIRIGQFWDRGIPDTLAEDPKYPERIALYRAAAQNKSRTLNVGDSLPLKSGATPLTTKIVTASGHVLPNEGPANPFAERHQPAADDPSDNAQSLSLLLTFGKFRFLTCGDLTWNVEGKLVTPNNPLGQVDVFMVTHHGLPVSNNPALVLAIDPRVAVMCNGPTKGGHPQTLATLKEVKSLQALYQLHRNVQLAEADQTPAAFIANTQETSQCMGTWVRVSVASDGGSYDVQIGPHGKPQTYQTR